MSGITIIIVNYKVKYFLRQCLQSIYSSTYDGSFEVVVVDNFSQDGSVDMVRNEFPDVKLIASQKNLGFSKANNLAIKSALYKYTLILNPDTILQEDTLSKCSSFLDNHNDAGAVVVKMVDGTGTYLPESKRGFPTPLGAIFKMTGLAKLFPKSKLFNHYYLGYLDSEKTQVIEVLTGAFCFMPTQLLQNIGGFDESYFMYGEDIELSFQIKESGYKIYYYPASQIIHFKGESTKKLSKRYLSSFYGAMKIYADKRNSSKSYLWTLVLSFGILLSAIVGITKKLIRTIIRPILDLIILFGTAKLIQGGWARFYHQNSTYYDGTNTTWIFLILLIVLLYTYFFFGQYDKRHNLKHLSYGFVFSTFVVLSSYSLLPETLRFSRLILLSTILLAPLVLYFSRRLYNKLSYNTFAFDTIMSKRVAVVGSKLSFEKIKKIVTQFSGATSLVGRIDIKQPQNCLGVIDDLGKIIESRGINEIIFCSRDLETQSMFGSMAKLGNGVSYKVANNDNTTILGSDSKERVGEWYTTNIDFKINQAFHIRSKRLLDIFVCILAIVLSPVVLIFSGRRKELFSKLFGVLLGKYTWIGYSIPDVRIHELPSLHTGVFSIAEPKSSENNHQSNLWYARNYSIWLEFSQLFKQIF